MRDSCFAVQIEGNGNALTWHGGGKRKRQALKLKLCNVGRVVFSPQPCQEDVLVIFADVYEEMLRARGKTTGMQVCSEIGTECLSPVTGLEAMQHHCLCHHPLKLCIWVQVAILLWILADNSANFSNGVPFPL